MGTAALSLSPSLSLDICSCLHHMLRVSAPSSWVHCRVTQQIPEMAHTADTHMHTSQNCKSVQTAKSGVSGYDLRFRFCLLAGSSESECHSSSRCSASAKSGDDTDAPVACSGLDRVLAVAACLLLVILDVAFGFTGSSEDVSQAGIPSSAHRSSGQAFNIMCECFHSCNYDMGLPSCCSAAVGTAVTGWSSSHWSTEHIKLRVLPVPAIAEST